MTGADPLTVDDLSTHAHDTYRVEFVEDYSNGGELRYPDDTDAANVISSRIKAGPHEGQHTVMLDIDVPAVLVPSSTPGHSHLYVDVPPLSWTAYRYLLDVLAAVGVIEDGYAAASIAREHTALRLPWIKKETPDNA